MTQVVRRSTKYTNNVLNIVRSKQHATNAEIAHELRKVHSEVSDTTVHRVTQRLYDDGLIGLAPPTKKGCLRYDGYTKLHDHFVCSDCGNLRDIKIADEVRRQIARELGDCYFDGPLTITGMCKTCQKRRE